MNKKGMTGDQLVIIVLIMVVSILIAGCQGGEQKDIDYRQGFPDLKIDVEDVKGFEGSPFYLKVWIQNLLGYDIENAEVSIVGLDESYVELFSSEESIGSIEGRSKLFGQGGGEAVTFEGSVLNLPTGIEKEIKSLYRIFVRYDSKVVLSEDVCVTPSLYSGVNDEGCQDENILKRGENKLSGQGAPVGFTDAEVIFRDQNAEFRLTIANKNKGKVGTIKLNLAALGGKALNCNFKTSGASQNTFDSFNFGAEKKEVTLICKGPITASSFSYETALLVDISYDYEFNVQKELLMAE